jgi:hypothetical protein
MKLSGDDQSWQAFKTADLVPTNTQLMLIWTTATSTPRKATLELSWEEWHKKIGRDRIHPVPNVTHDKSASLPEYMIWIHAITWTSQQNIKRQKPPGLKMKGALEHGLPHTGTTRLILETLKKVRKPSSSQIWPWTVELTRRRNHETYEQQSPN